MQVQSWMNDWLEQALVVSYRFETRLKKHLQLTIWLVWCEVIEPPDIKKTPLKSKECTYKTTDALLVSYIWLVWCEMFEHPDVSNSIKKQRMYKTTDALLASYKPMTLFDLAN